MFNIDPQVINFFAIPLSFFTVLFSILVIQWGMVNIISSSLSRISFNHPVLFRAMNWWGVFVHELSHAVTAIATFNKVTEFKVTSNGGYIVHESRGRPGFIQWMAIQFISVSPAFVPAIIAAALLRYLGYLNLPDIRFDAGGPVSIISVSYLDLIPHIMERVGWLFVDLDYTKVENMVLLLILTFSFPFAYPSSVKGKKVHQGDVQAFFGMFLEFPGYTILFVLLCFFSFWILFKYNMILFLSVFTFLTLLPILSFSGLVFNFLFIKLVNLFDNSSRLHIIAALSISILVYEALLQITSKQYIMNITTISVLFGVLKLK